jgi:hypothetical protein
LKARDTIRLKIRHEKVEKEVSITAVEASSQVFKVVSAARAESEKLAFRRAWFSGGRR